MKQFKDRFCDNTSREEEGERGWERRKNERVHTMREERTRKQREWYIPENKIGKGIETGERMREGTEWERG